MAEFLVFDRVPLSVIHQVGTYSDEYASRVRTSLAGNPLADQVFVRPGWYYGYERRR
jgi:ssDNA thymidine ADP-ribosyltransferase, DarT